MKILVQIRPLKHFEVFTLPKSFDTLEITLAEEKILQAQEVTFIEISLDQHNVFEVEENANCTVDDIHFFSAVQVVDPFTSHVELIRFKEYCVMPREGMSTTENILAHYLCALFEAIFHKVFPE